MTKNPFLNAIGATAYILVVSLIMYFGPKFMSDQRGEDTIVMPVAFISLFTLSAAVMGYIFLSYPLQLFLSGEKKEGINLFLKTVFVFAGITAISLIVTFSGII